MNKLIILFFVFVFPSISFAALNPGPIENGCQSCHTKAGSAQSLTPSSNFDELDRMVEGTSQIHPDMRITPDDAVAIKKYFTTERSLEMIGDVGSQ